jgi:hypothetical protein
VAFVVPRTAEVWMATGTGETSLEDAKWVYTALLHEHIPVDVISEQQLIEGKAADYKVLYVVGNNINHHAARKLEEWVKNGGILWTVYCGLCFDEAGEPLTGMNELIGVETRKTERWGYIPGYGSTTLVEIKNTAPVPAASAITLTGKEGEPLAACAAREVVSLKSTKDTSILATFADGAPAMLRHSYGKGLVYFVATQAGGAYSAKIRRADFDSRADYDPSLRSLITRAALDAGVYRPVYTDVPTLETLLLEKNGKRSVTLINWTYAAGGVQLLLENVRLDLPEAGNFKSVRSLQQGQLKVQGSGNNRFVILPTITSVDVLVLD